ncbi:MAG: chorismate synthase [Oscillospiraceae bacterium]|nr:chorismate synthase [Oscillospiraceae bacterium]
MSSTFGENLKVSIFGQSHSEAIGVVIDGFPAGFEIDFKKLLAFMARRAPGQGGHTTSRSEADAPHFLSGVVNNVTTGAPICAVIYNTNTRSKDYDALRDIPRPGHSDFTAYMKYGTAHDIRGGGQFSGRLTAPLCIAGALCLQYLEGRGVKIAAHAEKIGKVQDRRFNPTVPEFSELCGDSITVLSPDAEKAMIDEILAAKKKTDSVGGIIECAATGVPVTLGEPPFGGVENRIASIVFGIPAVKGIEFGAGFEVADMFGSENNDAFIIEKGKIKTETNNHGGALGGISSGMPIIFRAAVKPTPSIAKAQKSVSLSEMRERELVIEGRHDPCIVPRAIPVMEAAAAIAICDMML